MAKGNYSINIGNIGPGNTFAIGEGAIASGGKAGFVIPDQPDPEDAICTTCELPYTNRTDSRGCEEHTEFWCEMEANEE